MKRKNILSASQKKKVSTTQDTADVFNTLSLDQKTEVLKNLERSIETGLSPSGIKVEERHLPALRQLAAWCRVNILLGNELCPPSSLSNYKG